MLHCIVFTFLEKYVFVRQGELQDVASNDNLANLAEITEQTLLNELQQRYGDNRIYVSAAAATR